MLTGVLVLGTTFLLAVPAAGAQTPAQDSVTGRAVLGVVSPEIWTINASSGPSGENPTGTLELAFPVGATFPVTCLQVTGNRAVIGGHRIFTTADVWVYLIVVDEPGEVPDRVLSQLFINDPLAPATCAEYDARTPNEPGELCPICGRVVVIDAEPVPTSKEQCKNGGWRNFPGFKSQGDCVSFVATGGRNQPAGS